MKTNPATERYFPDIFPQKHKVVRVDNKYGVNKSVFKIETKEKNFFLKIMNNKPARRSIEGYNLVKEFIKTPQLIEFRRGKDETILIYDFVEGDIMTDLVLMAEKNNQTKNIYRREIEKNNLLLNMYLKKQNIMDANGYSNCNTNMLFRSRMLGVRMKEYYESDSTNISSLFDHDFYINGKKSNKKPSQIIKGLTDKFKNISNKTVDSYLVHGDVHHQNVIINHGINFIDLDYSGYAPIAMELAKPYYVDLLGTLFFFFEKHLLSLFELDYKIFDTKVEIEIQTKTPPTERLHLTKSKIKIYKNLIQKSRDFLTLNDYLVICHLTTRNPNLYSKRAQMLFFVLLQKLTEFDVFTPEELFYFS